MCRFFEKIFLLTNVSIDLALEMSFLTMNNIEVDFVDHYIH